ncbi:dynein regulatory complex subunit 7 isoform X2 [Notolabrus celidotus]|uniref:dynein regulatory complex subunit 7 isoform X2 n=1 Tax=Notolabrus celidotus TaxID=1203425 RepID=UPI00148FA335|nr:dynein regulatory complex subunit 7 isoform X2 [Notolabrus celidotus]
METVVESDREEPGGGGGTLEDLEGAHRDLNDSCFQTKAELCPESYRINSPNEIQMLKMADNFQRQFSHLFPEHKPLLLCAANECGVKKFVSTTLLPTSTSHPELYTWEGCASFVADFLSLVPLDPPEELPRTLFSPSSVLQSQRATCFEFASLLCSLLIGANYDAFCVSGFAVKEMCLLDQSLQECPLLDTPAKDKSVIPQQEEQQEEKYKLKHQRELKSRFLMQQEKKKQDADAALLQTQELQEQNEQQPADTLRGLRRHCWVLVLSGSRNVQENFFIDPLTGNRCSTDDDSFLGVDSVWDNFNYYVNMQDCSNGCSMVYDLEDVSLWEPVLFGATSKKKLILEVSKRKQEKLRRHVKDEEEKKLRVFEMPRSWVDCINISKQDLEDRWPGRKKATLYRRAKLERFSLYLRPDRLVTRLTTYKDLNFFCVKDTEPVRVKEWYKNRMDHLEEKEINKVDNVTSERFKHGRRFSLLFHRYSDTEQEMEFSSVRFDGLVRKFESRSELKEDFEGRPDFLYHRYAVFDPDLPLSGVVLSDVEKGWLQKVGERFHRNTSKPASEDVAERLFLTAHGRIEVTYHSDDHRAVPSKRSFIKPRESTNEEKAEDFRREMATSFQVDPADRPLSTLALSKIMKALKEDEETVALQIQQSREEVTAIVACRQKEQEDVQSYFSPWTATGAARVRSQKQELERVAAEEQKWFQERRDDVLASLLIDLDQTKTLDKKQAKELYQKCLSNFKERMVEQANLIQERCNKVTQELERKQQGYHKNQLTMTEEQVEEYQTYCQDTTLQIKVTSERMKMHKEASAKKYTALTEKLTKHPQLAPFLKS